MAIIDNIFNTQNDLLKVLLTLKDNINRDLKVGTLAKIVSYDNQTHKAIVSPFPLEKGKQEYYIEAYTLNNNNEYKANDIVAILFVDKDFRQNLSEIHNTKNSLSSISENSKLHSNEYGVIIAGGTYADSGDEYELLKNKVTEILSTSTNTEYPSAKAVYDIIQDVIEYVDNLITSYYTKQEVDNKLANKQNVLNEAQLNAVNSGITTELVQKISSNETNILAINDKIPNQATSTNQLADKDFVNSSLNNKQDKITQANKLDFSLIDNVPSTPEYSISKDGDIYKLLKDGQQVGVSINIPKDLVVNSGRVETIAGKTYIVLVLNDTQKTEIKIEADKLIDVYSGDNTTIVVDENRQISVKSGVFQPKGDYALKSDIPTNYVTTNTEQTITGYKTFNAPANKGSTEQFTVKFKTSNGGSVLFGKEAANSGTMMRLDQVDGTCRLRFRGSATPGAIVWEQPETGAALYFDLGNGNNKHRITMPSKQGTLALKSDIPTLTFAIESDITNIWTT